MSKPTAKIALWLCAALAAALATAAPAMGSEAIQSFSISTSTAQAGAHPDLGVSVALDSPGVPESARNLILDTPEGLFGNPNAISRCSASDFALAACPSNTQAGLITIRANYAGNPDKVLGTAPIYDLAPGEDQTALFGFIVPTLNVPVQIPVALRTGSDFGLRFTVANLTQLAPLHSAQLTFWGFPDDPGHDAERFPKGSAAKPAGCLGFDDATCILAPVSSGVPTPLPLIDNPSICTGDPLAATLSVSTYQDPDNPTQTGATLPPTSGCYAPSFEPVLQATPTSTQADSAAGLDLVLHADQTMSTAPTSSPIKSAVLTLPDGLTINPDAADGQSSCSDAQANFGSEGPAACPDNAKIGTFAVGSPALDGPLSGSIYLGEPKPGEQYRLFLIADGFGIHAKFLATMHPDPVTGQVSAQIDDLPQVPFDNFALHLFASDRGLMATPTRCTVYPILAHFFPWNGLLADVVSTQFFGIDSGPNGSPCSGQVRPFNPRLVAGTATPTAGAFSNFALRLDRDDGDQNLGDLNFTFPPGFTGNLRGVSYCPDASIAAAADNPGATEQAAPSCPASSEIGTTDVAAGPGSHPFHALGKMYFAGPYQGAPFSAVAITPALAGPYDYGTVVVRVALHVDPLTAQVKAVSGSIPQVIGGVPIRLRSIGVDINRTDSSGNPNFTINPTNCSPFAVDSQAVGDQGTLTNFSSYFHVVNCSTLGFRPKMTMTQLSGGIRRSANPSFRVDLDTRGGDANVKSLAVTLPNAFQIDQRHLGNICSEAELAAKRCAGRQTVGTASVTTPLLDQPLSGPVYAVSGSGRLPRLAFILDGQVTIIPRADETGIRGGRLKTTVPVIPDAPIGHFSMVLNGGGQGYLVNTKNLCAGKAPVSDVSYVAQNGARLNQKVPFKARCPKGHKRAKHKRHKRHHR